MPANNVILLTKISKDGVYLDTKILFYTDQYIERDFGGGQVFNLLPFSSATLSVTNNRAIVHSPIDNSDDGTETVVTLETGSTVETFTNTGDNNYNDRSSVISILDFNLEYVDQSGYVDTYIFEAAQDPATDELYLAGHLFEDTDLSVFNTSTISAAKVGNINPPSFNTVYAKYTSSLDLSHYGIWGAEEQVTLEGIAFEDNSFYIGFEHNSAAEGTFDRDGSGAVDTITLHEHDPVVQKYDTDGNLLWSYEVTSNDVPDGYNIDDEYISGFAVSDKGEVFFGFYSDSEAIVVGDVLYESNLTGNNNAGEPFILSITKDGGLKWVRKGIADGTSSYAYPNSFEYDPYNDMLVAAVHVTNGSFTYDGTYIDLDFITTDFARNNVFLFVDEDDGSLITHTQNRLLTGTSTQIFNINPAKVSLHSDANGTKYTYLSNYNGSSPTFDIDWSPSVAPFSPFFLSQLYVTHSWTVDRNPPPSLENISIPTAENCSSTPPGQKDPVVFGAQTVSNSQVELYIAPGDQPFNQYHLVYGTEPGVYRYGALHIDASDQIMTYAVDELKPATTYYFRIVAVNGCATSDFSNEASATTTR